MKRTALLLILLVACKAKPAPEAPVAAEAAPPPLALSDRPGLLFTYLDGQGHLQSTEKLAEIPADRLRGVRVIDLSVSPEQRGAGRFIYVADLRKPNADGSYPYQVLSAVAYERAVSSAATDQKVADAIAKAPSQVTLYSTAWCGACAKARAYFEQHKISFVDRDVERDESAQAELAEKARRAGVVPQGVPVIDLYGDLVMGFDPKALDARLLRRSQRAQEETL